MTKFVFIQTLTIKSILRALIDYGRLRGARSIVALCRKAGQQMAPDPSAWGFHA